MVVGAGFHLMALAPARVWLKWWNARQHRLGLWLLWAFAAYHFLYCCIVSSAGSNSMLGDVWGIYYCFVILGLYGLRGCVGQGIRPPLCDFYGLCKSMDIIFFDRLYWGCVKSFLSIRNRVLKSVWPVPKTIFLTFWNFLHSPQNVIFLY